MIHCVEKPIGWLSQVFSQQFIQNCFLGNLKIPHFALETIWWWWLTVDQHAAGSIPVQGAKASSQPGRKMVNTSLLSEIKPDSFKIVIKFHIDGQVQTQTGNYQILVAELGTEKFRNAGNVAGVDGSIPSCLYPGPVAERHQRRDLNPRQPGFESQSVLQIKLLTYNIITLS